MKKIITKALLKILFVGMLVTLVLNLFLQLVLNIKEFREVSEEHFWQIEVIVNGKEKSVEQLKANFAEDCIIRARAAAYLAQHDPSVVDNLEECRLIASLIQVDELHFFTPEGVIYAGTNPKYYGYSVESGEQIGFFAPIFEDKSLELCQDITPNTAEGKLMQYTAVWCPDGKKVVQVGLEPKRVLEAIKDNSVSDIFAVISSEQDCEFFGINALTGEIIGATDESYIGRSMEETGVARESISEELSYGICSIDGEKQYYAAKQADNLILVKVCPLREIIRKIVISTLLLCIYFTILLLLLTLASYYFIEKKIICIIIDINKKLKEIEQGNWNRALTEESMPEFSELCSYINSMVGSLQSFSGKISKSLEVVEVPIGIVDYSIEKNSLTATSRVKDILMMTPEEYQWFIEHPREILEKDNGLFVEEKELGKYIYSLRKDRKRFVRIEMFDYQKSKMAVLIDITADILEKREISKERDTDVLTGLYNRRAFYRLLDSLFKEPKRRQNGLIFAIDLDNLKKINDIYGHEEGDKYIQALAQILQQFDYKNKLAARMGGDEFALFLYGLADMSEGDSVCERLLALRDSRQITLENGDSVTVRFSVGWAFCPQETEDYRELMKEADERMYEDKRRRKEQKKMN